MTAPGEMGGGRGLSLLLMVITDGDAVVSHRAATWGKSIAACDVEAVAVQNASLVPSDIALQADGCLAIAFGRA